jgi:hypothetical protein
MSHGRKKERKNMKGFGKRATQKNETRRLNKNKEIFTITAVTRLGC